MATSTLYSELLPVLVQCFVIILAGYVGGRSKLIGASETRGIHVFVTYFSLPALVFHSLATLNLADVSWRFLASILIGKTCIFAVVTLFSVLLCRSAIVGKAGLYAIFCTQSNDFALGYPLISYLFEKTHPEFCRYLYLIAPIQLMILNPIGFILMEYQKQSDSRSAVPFRQTAVKTLKGVVANPIIIMTFLGMAWNVIFGSQVPNLVEKVVCSLGEAFPASALFLLGACLVGKASSMEKRTMLVPVMLVSVKIVASPLLIRELVNLLNSGKSESETKDFSDFGFLYGMLPTAPTVFIYASEFCLPSDVVATGMVAGTFISAPFIFVSATMSQVSSASLEDFQKSMEKTMIYVSCISIACTSWILFVVARKLSRVTHGTLLFLALSQLITALGGVLWSATTNGSTVFIYIQCIMALGGIFATRIWTALLSITLALLHWRSLCFVLKIRWLIIALGFGSSIVVTSILFSGMHPVLLNQTHIDPNFQFGDIQAGVAVGVLSVCFITTVMCLLIGQRFRSRTEGYVSLETNGSDFEETSEPPSPSTGPCQDCNGNCQQDGLPDMEDILKAQTKQNSTTTAKLYKNTRSLNCAISDMEPIPSTSSDRRHLCSSEFECDQEQRKLCAATVEIYNQEEHPDESICQNEDPHQIFQHELLLLLLCISMIIGLAVSLWQLFTDAPTGILVELEYLDILLNYGQGILTFAVFGLDTYLVLNPIARFWKYLVNCNKTAPTNSRVIQVCQQFKTCHYDTCLSQISLSRCDNNEDISFYGNSFVDWLLLAGLAQERTKAVEYGQCLLEGGVIRHVNEKHNFQDKPYLYIFLPT